MQFSLVKFVLKYLKSSLSVPYSKCSMSGITSSIYEAEHINHRIKVILGLKTVSANFDIWSKLGNHFFNIAFLFVFHIQFSPLSCSQQT